MQWLPGHKLKSRPYEIEREIGEGGFGITYKAKNLTLDIPVVIKTPNRKLQRDGNYQKYVTNFTREAKQLAKLGLNPHPHIVRVSDLFEEDKLPCIVMDFIPGESLYDMVWSQGKISEAKAVEYIKQIGSALSVCHKAGIIHRDVHPNNILIHADNGKAILIDFGISGTTQTSRNTHSGNRSFAPWEQMAYWEGESSKTPQVDIYTLAASLYYLVTGEEPKECLARKYNNSELIEPKQLNPELSDTINQAILKGMEVLPGDRPNSMQEWLELLSATFHTSATPKDIVITPAIKTRKENSNRQNRTINKGDRNNPLAVPKVTQPIKKTYIDSKKKRDRASAKTIVQKKVPHSSKLSKPLPKLKKPIIGGLIFFLTIAGLYTTNHFITSPRWLIGTLNHSNNVIKLVAFSPDSKTLASGGGDDIKLWDITTKQQIATLTGHSESVRSVAFSPDGKTLASGSWDDTIKLWDIATKQQIATFTGHSEDVKSVAFSPDGKTLASGSDDDTIKLWDITTKQEIATLRSYLVDGNSIAFSPDGKTLASGSWDDTIKLWDITTKQEIAAPSTGYSSIVKSVAFSPDGKTLASSGSWDDTIKLWDIATKQQIATFTGHSESVRSVAFSPDGKTLASGSWDDTIKLWDITTKQEIATFTGHSDNVDSVAFSPDGKTLASSSDDKTIKLWSIPPDLK